MSTQVEVGAGAGVSRRGRDWFRVAGSLIWGAVGTAVALLLLALISVITVSLPDTERHMLSFGLAMFSFVCFGISWIEHDNRRILSFEYGILGLTVALAVTDIATGALYASVFLMSALDVGMKLIEALV